MRPSSLPCSPSLVLVIALGSTVACRSETEPPSGHEATPPTTADDMPPAVVREVVANMDRKVDPCTDFYQFACGGWLDTVKPPPEEPRFGRFNVLREQNLAALRELAQKAAADTEADPTSGAGMLGRFYSTCMDEDAIEQRGAEPLAPVLAEIDGIHDRKGMMQVAALLHRRGIGTLFDVEPGPDLEHPDLQVLHLSQGGLGLPDRDYYLEDGPQQKALREGYRAHVAAMLDLVGERDPKAAADDILRFETELAQIALPREVMRNPEQQNNPIDPAGLAKAAPAFPWPSYFAALGYPKMEALNLAPAPYFEGLSRLVGNTPVETVKTYMRWHLVHRAAPHLSSAFVDEDFAFYHKTLRGQQSLAPRWKRCVQATDAAIGDLLGQQYVQARFAGDSRGVALDMIQQIEAAFLAGLPALDWMDDTTRSRAREKMEAIVNKIGYRDHWKSYDGLTVGADYLGNLVAAIELEFDRETRKVGGPVDKTEWHMTPPTVNAYYNPPNNEMVFPAGILQPPFFHPDYPMAMNFGGIGMVMGHELTHGFDDQGRKFDGQGRLRQWWDPQAVARFEDRAACVEKLYDGYEVQPGLHLNGKLTLGENIADFGGIKRSYRAYVDWAEAHGVDIDSGAVSFEGDAAGVDGLTRAQLFFVAYGQLWCTKSTPEVERVMAMTDPHSHPHYRVNGPLSNMPEFWQTFSCGEDAAMHQANACEVW